MIKKLILVIALFLSSCGYGFSQELIVDFEPKSLPVLNEELRKYGSRITTVEDPDNLATGVTGVLKVINGGTGQDLTNTTAGSVWYDNGSNPFTKSDAGVLGQVLLSGGATGIVYWGNTVEMFTTGGTWICPAGVNYVAVSLAGGGGGGGSGGNASGGGGGGGGAGGVTENHIFPTVPGAEYTITLGSGGAGGASGGFNNGANGADSTFSKASGTPYTLTAGGGGGGTAGSNGGGGSPAGGSGGTVGTGLDGGNATTSIYYGYTGVAGGAGGDGASGDGAGGQGACSKMFSGGGAGGTAGGGDAGDAQLLSSGGGGGGARVAGSGASAGGDGLDGFAMLIYNLNGTPY